MKKEAKIIPMSKEILDVINAVIDYGRWIWSHNRVVRLDNNYDHVVAMEKYYRSLPLPAGMSKNHADFERILQVGWYSDKVLLCLNNTNESELCNISWKPRGVTARLDETSLVQKVAEASQRSKTTEISDETRQEYIME